MSSKQPGSGSSTSFIETSLIDDFYPIRAPLCAKYKKTFAYKTIGYRLPVILTKIIDQLSRDKNEIGENYGLEARTEIKNIVGSLAKLKNELQTNKPITPGNSSVWNAYLSQVASRYHNGLESEVTYYLSPWLFIECYMYHRIQEAFSSTLHLKCFDYAQKQKQDGFLESIEQSTTLANYFFSSSCELTEENLQSLLEMSLWGNRCDLSLSAGESSQSAVLLDQLRSLKTSILCDNSDEVWKTLKTPSSKDAPKSIGYILDNSGFELFTDLCLADALLNFSQIEYVDFYVKDIPWFISDAMATDFQWLLNTMETINKPIMNQLAQKWKSNVQNNRWRVLTFDFWTFPHSFNEMEISDPKLYARLSNHHLLIFKGDLNYRKLVGDINWEPETPFKEVLRGFLPAPLVALRTCKADTVAGLPFQTADVMNSLDPNWLITGQYGLIQFASP